MQRGALGGRILRREVNSEASTILATKIYMIPRTQTTNFIIFSSIFSIIGVIWRFLRGIMCVFLGKEGAVICVERRCTAKKWHVWK